MEKITIKNEKGWKELKNGYLFEDKYNTNKFVNEKEPKRFPCVLVLDTQFYNDGMYSEETIIFIYKSDFNE